MSPRIEVHVLSHSHHDRRGWLRRCLASLYAQTLPIEIKLIEAATSHCGNLRADAMEGSTADYLSWVDDDDYLPRNAYEVAMRHMGGADYFCSGFQYTGWSERSVAATTVGPQGGAPKSENLLGLKVFKRTAVAPYVQVMRDWPVAEDAFLSYSMLRHTKVVTIEDVLYFKEQHEGCTTRLGDRALAEKIHDLKQALWAVEPETP